MRNPQVCLQEHVLVLEPANVHASHAAGLLLGLLMAGANKELSKDALRKLGEKGFVDTYYGDDPTKYYEAFDMCTAKPKLSTEAEDAAKSMRPIDVFLYFLPKKFWRDIAVETNRYERQSRNDQVKKAKVRRTNFHHGLLKNISHAQGNEYQNSSRSSRTRSSMLSDFSSHVLFIRRGLVSNSTG